MANEPKMEDFPTITKWLKALEKYGDAKREARASNNISFIKIATIRYNH